MLSILVVAALTTSTAPAAARPEAIPEAQAIRADLEKLKADREAKDKSALKTDLLQLKIDWSKLRPALKERLEKNHPELLKLLEKLKEERGGAVKV